METLTFMPENGKILRLAGASHFPCQPNRNGSYEDRVMAVKALPSPEVLRQLLRYEPETGKLFWKPREPSVFEDGKHSASRTCAKWNTRLAGKPALNIMSHGYMRGSILGRTQSAHRVIWAMVHNEWPDGEIDHIDADPANNRIENLRRVTHQQNSLNRKKRIDSTSGVKGVSWHRGKKMWRARVMTDGHRRTVGNFVNLEDAAAAVASHRSFAHGEFTRHE